MWVFSSFFFKKQKNSKNERTPEMKNSSHYLEILIPIFEIESAKEF